VSKQHSICSIDEAYYLVEGMMFVFPCRFGAKDDDVIPDVMKGF
jgi:hypothetical protein